MKIWKYFSHGTIYGNICTWSFDIVSEASKFSFILSIYTNHIHGEIEVLFSELLFFSLFKVFAKWMLYLCVGVAFCICIYALFYVSHCCCKMATPFAFDFHFADCLNGDNKPEHHQKQNQKQKRMQKQIKMKKKLQHIHTYTHTM